MTSFAPEQFAFSYGGGGVEGKLLSPDTVERNELATWHFTFPSDFL